MATLRYGAAALGLAHRLRVYTHRQACVQSLDPHEIVLVSRSGESERSHQAFADAKFGSSWTNGCGDEGSIRQGTYGLPVHDHRHQRGHRFAIDAIDEQKRPSSRWDGTMEISLGKCRNGRQQATRGGEQERRVN
jgi:hypothetical protein